jgi:hypothetical protein
MIRTKNPRIDIEELRARVAQEMERADSECGMQDTKLSLELHIRAIEQSLLQAEERSAPRTTWPDNLKLFPFSLSPRLRAVALRVLGLAMRDQQEVNAALIRSQRETIVLLRAVLDRLRDEDTE